ncbi:MAG: NUDIX hydrolase [Actinomycetaceae bacterium]|nr:NUDIX hydrolase [Actinomycetaceae bacterium]
MTELRDVPAPGHVDVLETKDEYHGHIIDVVDDALVLKSTGARMTREYIVHDDAVAVVPIRHGASGAEVLLIRQYRHPVRTILWEIPAGLLDVEGEDPRAAAERELAEEVDMAAGRYEFLATFFCSPGCSTERLTVFMAEDLTHIDTDFVRQDEEAEITTAWFPLADVLAAVRRGELSSPTLVVGVLAACGRLGVDAA